MRWLQSFPFHWLQTGGRMSSDEISIIFYHFFFSPCESGVSPFDVQICLLFRFVYFKFDRVFSKMWPTRKCTTKFTIWKAGTSGFHKSLPRDLAVIVLSRNSNLEKKMAEKEPKTLSFLSWLSNDRLIIAGCAKKPHTHSFLVNLFRKGTERKRGRRCRKRGKKQEKRTLSGLRPSFKFHSVSCQSQS